MNRKQWIPVIWILILAAGVGPALAAGGTAEETHEISGRVTDFQDRPVQGVSVELKNSRFDTVASAVSDDDGRYSLTAPKGDYMALTAVRDYQTKYLEYWAWNVPLDRDIEINPRFDRLEVYAINAWRPQGGYPSYQIYFRPMSLTRVTKKIEEAGGMEGLSKLPVVDISPDLTVQDIVVMIDGQIVNLLEVNKVREAAGPGQYMFGYLIQTDLPEKPAAGDHIIITITIRDSETGEKGEGCLFFKPARMN
jgi:hypothetical protein